MQRRILLSLVNIAVAVVALTVILAFPQFAGYAIYVFLAWFVVSFSLVWAARGTTPSAGLPGAAVPTPSRPSPAPAPPLRGGASAPSEPAPIAFCIYCAADLPPGADRCSACGHANARLA